MNTDSQTAACIAELNAGKHTYVVLDFDQTLFLDNSTERFLDSLRPRALAFVIVACTDWLIQLLGWLGVVHYNHQRDFMRVFVCTVLMPWNHFLWPRAAQRLANASMNRALLDTLPSGRPVIVLSYGFRHIIAPILKAAGLKEVTLICSNALPPFKNLRTSGKLKALEARVPVTEWNTLLFITDSEDDAEVIAACPNSHVMKWCPRPEPAFTGLYLPLRYTVEGKYPGCRYFTTQIVLEDLALLLLAYAFSWSYAAALVLLFLSLYTIYEIGYYENDRVAIKYETTPVVSESAKTFSGFSKTRAWLWALVFTVGGIVCAWPDYIRHPYRQGIPFLFDLACWFAVLGGLYLVFFCFNRLAPAKRLALFPVLHLFKTFSFVIFVPLTIAGVLLLLAQVISISTNYFIYRRGGRWQRFNRQACRLVLFLVSAAVLWLLAPALFPGGRHLRMMLIFFWGVVRALEQARHKNILRLFADGFRAGPPPTSRHDAAQRKE